MTQKYINDLAYKVVGCAIEVHKIMGPGLLESIYQKCMLKELSLNKIEARQEHRIPLIYKGEDLDSELIIDILIKDCLVVELKSVEKTLPIHKAQLLTYLKLTEKPKGLLINFNTENITSSLVPIVTEKFAGLSKE
ncbi:MAG TPA: GxxExxY protein [Ignavibacteria bacterium]|nr:GxxExxY protein [Ignavibacteria bacterium]HMQ99599.1 GxxExxY protein [Ignavibacteria bacterium]